MKCEDFNRKIMSELTPTELALINTNIYFNPECINYYIDFQLENYGECYKFLMKNRHLLTIEHTPGKWKGLAVRNVRSMKILNGSIINN